MKAISRNTQIGLSLLFLIAILAPCLVFSGCSYRNSPGSQELAEPTPRVPRNSPEVHKLEKELTALLGHKDPEVSRLAYTAIQQTNVLAKQYHVTGFPLLHNFLVNVGIKDRGLCCHWTEDLLKTLTALDLKQFRFVWAVSNYGNFREHNCIAVIPAKKELKDSLILDPWRKSGKLYWAPIDQDSYEWHLHPGYNGRSSNISCEAEIK